MMSIVTPSFQQLDWLRLAMASVADQRGVEIEHIIQDAGTAGVREMFEGATKTYQRDTYEPKLFIEKDEGMYDAINRGLRRVTGDICAYLNCDEQYLPGTLAKVSQFLNVHPEIDVLFGDVVLINTHGFPISYRRTILPSLQHIRVAHLNTATCATFFRHRLLEQGFYFDLQWKSIGDGVWIEALLRAGVPMATLPEPFAVFTQTGQNLSANELSRVEARRWRDRTPFPKAQTAAIIAWHRCRKALAGAYRLRRVEVNVFTHDSPTQRCRAVERVGFRWASV